MKVANVMMLFAITVKQEGNALCGTVNQESAIAFELMPNIYHRNHKAVLQTFCSERGSGRY